MAWWFRPDARDHLVDSRSLAHFETGFDDSQHADVHHDGDVAACGLESAI